MGVIYKNDIPYSGGSSGSGGGGGGELEPTVLTGILQEGQTTLVFTDDAISSTTRIDTYSSVYGLVPANMVVNGNTLTLTYHRLHEAALIQVHCWNGVTSDLTVLTDSLPANQTTLSFTDDSINSGTRIDVYSTVFGLVNTGEEISNHTLTLQFPSSHEAASIKVHCWN